MATAPKQAPTPYVPSFIKSILEGARSIKQNFSQSNLTNFSSTSSFFYDPPGVGLRSTQQLNVDWSQFQNHTFFNSAEVSVNTSFDTIINKFPFDGTKKEYEVFFEKLTGYEKWVYDNFPKNTGFLYFSGTQPVGSDQGGTFIQVNDYAGGLYPSISKLKTGQSLLDPGLSSFSIELQLYVPPVSNVSGSIICQKMSGSTAGYALMTLPTGSTTTVPLMFACVSGSMFMSATMSVPRGQFNHVCAILNRDGAVPQAQLWNNGQLQGISPNIVNMGPFGVTQSPFLIGSGTAVTLGTQTFTPGQSLSASIDELRVWQLARTSLAQQQFAQKAVYSQYGLNLYYKFNEPSGTIGSTSTDQINSIVLDSSGNSLHSLVSNFSASLRSTPSGTLVNPMVYERMDLSPVLFAQFGPVSNFNSTLLASASSYDDANPNIITRLIPEHYLMEGQAYEGQETTQGPIVGAYSNQPNMPGSARLGSVQLMQTFLYVWAKFFDEMKLYVDAFSTLNYVGYDSTDTAPDSFLPLLFKQMGFQIPSIFLDASIEQFIDGENTDFQITRGAFPLKYVENQILRRILISMLEIVRSKGTQRSVKAFMRACGLNPDNGFRIREFGGPTSQPLNFARENKIEPSTLLNMSGSGSFKPLLVSPYLTASRVEPGFPGAIGPFVSASLYQGTVSTNANDGLLTSGSWTYEGIYKFPPTLLVNPASQSLARMLVTGSSAALGGYSSQGGMIFNCIGVSSSLAGQPMVVLYGRPSAGSSLANAPVLRLQVNANVFDGKKWNVAFGRIRNDELGSVISSSYFLRVARQEYGAIRDYFSASAYFNELGVAGTGSLFTGPAMVSASQNVLENTTAIFNASGSFLQFGSSSLSCGSGSASYRFLNQTDVVTGSETQSTFFNGMMTQARFWSKALTELEWQEHVRNYKSLGVQDPLTSFNFVTNKSGSWGKLRIDASCRQVITASDASGNLTVFDYSQGNNHLQGTNFITSSNQFVVDLFNYSMISPHFDDASTNEKVRVRSYQDFSKVQATPWAQVAPVYRLDPSEPPTDDVRFSVEFSIIDALNRDIVNIFSTLDALDNIIGSPELMWASDYPNLSNLRDVYFSRLTSKIDIKAWFEFFRWFSSSIGIFIDQLLPRKTEFLGTNFVIESHMLERSKFEHLNNTMYLGEADRDRLKDTVLLQLLEGAVRRY